MTQAWLGVQLQHGHARMACGMSLDAAHAHRVFAADDDDEFVFVEIAADALAHGGYHGFGRGAFGNGRGREDALTKYLAGGFDVEELHIGRSRDDGLRTAVGALHPRRGFVVGNRQHDDACRLFPGIFGWDRTEIGHQTFRFTRWIG